MVEVSQRPDPIDSTPWEDVVDLVANARDDLAIEVGSFRSPSAFVDVEGLTLALAPMVAQAFPPPGQPRLVGADASHAWCSVWTPKDGWVDFDPTNGHLPVNEHVTVAWGRDYADVIPVRGVMIGPATSQDLSVSVDVARRL